MAFEPPAPSSTPPTEILCTMRPIGVVSSETGIDPATLRVWERRYGFPKPARVGSGHRFYTEMDVALLLQIARALRAGFRPGQLFKSTPEDLQRLLASVRVSERDAAAAGTIATKNSFEQFAPMIRELDTEALRREFGLRAIALGPRHFVTDFAAPFSEWVGESWEKGSISIHEEHFVTNQLQSILRGILAQVHEPPSAPRIVLTTLPGETHSLGIKMAAIMISVAGGSARVLGPETPPGNIVNAAIATKARAVGISISVSSATRGTAQRLQLLRETLPKNIELWIGGNGAIRLQRLPKNIHRVRSSGDLERLMEALVKS
ncbi:MAG: MerR family transcriptional regulator [Planctomycetota bacterium]